MYFWVKYKIRYSVSETVWNFFSSKISSIRYNYYLEKRKSFGDANPETIFYVIRRRPPGWGYFSNLFHVAQGLLYAEEKGYTPIVDMENYWMSELSSVKGVDGEKNAWCYFFKQVSEYSLSQVYQSKNVILSDASRISGGLDWLTNRDATLITNLQLLQKTHITLKADLAIPY